MTGHAGGAAADGAGVPPWWHTGVIYQVYLRSFADGSGDGVGDLPGLRSRLPYLAELGVDALWITPWYPSPMADGGYDVADFRAIDPLFGTLADARAVIDDAHALGLRVVVDIVPNHTSSAHAWFREALAAGPGSRERERYLFRDGRGPAGDLPPNNWPAAFGGPAWTRVTEADGRPGQWYLHLFDPGQPDLNWASPEVRTHFEEILRFWFDLGLDGFRVDVAMGLVKDPALPDLDPGILASEPRWAADDHPYWGQEGVHDIWRGWRAIADEYAPPRSFVGEVALMEPSRLARFARPDELHAVFNFDFLKCAWSAPAYRAVVDTALASMSGVGAAATWVLSNHDEPRHLTRLGWPETGWRHPLLPQQGEPDLALGERRARAAVLLMLALPGGAFLYQGEELGLEQVLDLPDDVLQDPTWERSGHTIRGRDGCRVPIPWADDAPPFGFSPADVRPWLPQPAAWRRRTAAAEAADPRSMLTLYRTALRLRRAAPGLGGEAFVWVDSGADVLHFQRGGGFGCLVNLGAAPVPLPAGARVLLRSDGADTAGPLGADAAVWYTRS